MKKRPLTPPKNIEMIRALQTILQDPMIRSGRPETLQAITGIAAGRSVTRSSFANARSLMNSIFDYAADQDYILSNPARLVSSRGLKFKIPDHQDEIYTNEEREKAFLTGKGKEHPHRRIESTEKRCR